MRAMWAVAAMGALLQGCVVYAHTNDGGKCGGGDDVFEPGPDMPSTTTTTTTTTGGETDTPPEDTGPTAPVDFALAFDPAFGVVGDTLLVSLVVTDGEHDLSTVTEVGFGGEDVTVLDVDARADEVLLVVEIAADATPGPIDAFVLDAGGDAWLLADSFTIVTHAGTDPGDTGVYCP